MASMRPLRDYLIVKPLEVPYAGLIQVVDVGAKRPTRAEVVAVGPGKKRADGSLQALDVRVGDVVQFTDVMNFTHYYDENRVKHLLIQEADVCGVEVHDDQAQDAA